jgi:hypothetical protein
MKITILTFLLLAAAVLKIPGRLSDKAPFHVPEVQKDTSRYIFVGVVSCAAKCHNNSEMGFQYDIWRQTSHARGFEVLTSDLARKYSEDAGILTEPARAKECLKCHVTAFGADTASLSPEYRIEEGITCEACHKAEFRRKTFLPEQEDCLICHNGSIHSVPVFNFREMYREIAHPRPPHGE